MMTRPSPNTTLLACELLLSATTYSASEARHSAAPAQCSSLYRALSTNQDLQRPAQSLRKSARVGDVVHLGEAILSRREKCQNADTVISKGQALCEHSECRC